MAVANLIGRDNAGFKAMDFCEAISLLDLHEPELEIDLQGIKVVKTKDEMGNPIVLVIDEMRSGEGTSAAVYC